ncbi:MAG: PilZ domain-containing protein [Spirochaetota bacterium]|nr:PilZ domain-containing protein [Spirochaetota bacterium]
MESLRERRIAKRCDTFWLAYNNINNTLLGYITDLSVNGLKMWLLKDKKPLDTLFITIDPPKETKLNKLNFNIKIMWTEKDSNHSIFEAGAEFENLSSSQKSNLKKIISIFSKDINKLFKDLEIAIKNSV